VVSSLHLVSLGFRWGYRTAMFENFMLEQANAIALDTYLNVFVDGN